jgi:hypothetical protein
MAYPSALRREGREVVNDREAMRGTETRGVTACRVAVHSAVLHMVMSCRLARTEVRKWRTRSKRSSQQLLDALVRTSFNGFLPPLVTPRLAPHDSLNRCTRSPG